MKKIWKKGLSLVLAVMMVAGLLSTTAFAAVNSTGRPLDVNNSLVLSIYIGEGFPGEPAVYGTSNYKNFDSGFKVKSGATFARSANAQLDWAKIDKDIVQGTSSGTTSVWGVYDANGTKDYFLSGATIIQPANEAKMIRAIKTELKNKSDAEVLQQYEIVWYVIKLQHGSGWRGVTEWHIDGVIKEKEKVSINYYGNGNTSGSAPLGVASHTAGDPYTVLDKNSMKKENGGVEVAFLGWSAKADGTGAEAGFYQPGDVIYPQESISLYAMWDTTTQYTATVNTYLDGVLTSDSAIHGADRNLALSTDGEHFYDLTEGSTGVYTVNITGNGKFHLYAKEAGGNYTQIGTHQLTIYNQNGKLDVHHYSVTYDPDGGSFAADPGKQAYAYGAAVSAINAVPSRAGYRFLGWEDAEGDLIQPGEDVTASITEPITLTAKWEKTVNVTVNVTIDHNGGDGQDKVETRDEVFLTLVSRENGGSPYLEVQGKTLDLSEDAHVGFAYDESDHVTTYTADGVTFSDMPGGEAGYTVVTSKSGYDTVVTETQDANGDWTIYVKMVYNPTNFDLEFSVRVDESVPDRYLPEAAIVKVTFWSNANQRWETITQQEGSLPGVRVDIDPNTRTGSGSYPVWKYESAGNTPYGYRIQIASFVYPDDTIVPASEIQADVKWSDDVYTADMDAVVGGQTYGTLDGAYFADASESQEGTLSAVISMELYDVTFDAKGGKVNGSDSQTVEELYKIPGFKDYVPSREGGYTFGGWYEDEACTEPAKEGEHLDADITLYAKWIEPLTVSGTVTISGTYEQNGETVSVHDIDRAKEAVVVLQELRNGTAVDVDSVTVSFGEYEASGSSDYHFTGIPNDGKLYQIHVLVLNYGTAYDNESDADSAYSESECLAVFNGDSTADVDALLTFVPPSYNQVLNVDATQIGDGFKPQDVLSEVMYRDTGDNHAFQRISQHDVEPYGVEIELDGAGLGENIQSIWKWHTDGTLYDYQMNVTKVDGKAYDSDTAPYYIDYAAPAYWNANADAPSGELLATLIPKEYPVIFDLNAGTDTVTGMDAYKVQESYTDEEDNVVVSYTYQTEHTWSFDTEITAGPVREGHTFKGWTADVENAYADGEIDASVHQAVVLTAQWEKNNYIVTTNADPAEGGETSGDGNYAWGTSATVIAAANENYVFEGWYESGEKVSAQAEYTFTVIENRTLTAEFTFVPPVTYTINAAADPAEGGTVSGAGTYDAGTAIVVSAAANDGYVFEGWYESGEKVSDDAEYAFTVTEDRTLIAEFSVIPPVAYTINAAADPAEGGTVSGAGTYEAGTAIVVSAAANDGYVFEGWYESGEKVSDDAEYAFTVTEDRTLIAEFSVIPPVTYKNSYAYIFGYDNVTMGAEGPLLRSEAAVMVHRLAKQNNERGGFVYDSANPSFADIAGEWFQSGIEYIHYRGGFTAQEGANVYPYAQITRGEVFKIVALGLGFTENTRLTYDEYGTLLMTYGYIKGENNSGYLNSEGQMSRAEFCTMYNRIIGRANALLVDKEGNQITAETYGFTDLDPDAWYYEDMLRATSAYDENGYVDIGKRAERNVVDDYS